MPQALRMRSRVIASVAVLALPFTAALSLDSASASAPSETTLTAPADEPGTTKTVTESYGGTVTSTGTIATGPSCTDATCDEHTLHMQVPADYWDSHTGSVKLEVSWQEPTWDLDVYVRNSAGAVVGEGGATDQEPENVDLGMLPGGDYTIEVHSYLAQPGIAYAATITFTTTPVNPAMTLSEDRDTLMDELTIRYPLRVIFVGRHPSAAEIAELRASIPDTYQPTVSNKSGSPGGEPVPDPAGATGLLNWNTVHYGPGENPYFLGMRYKYDLQILQASDDYAKALFQVAKDHTAADQSYRDDTMTAQQVKYDQTNGRYRVLAKRGDTTYQVADPTKQDLVDSYAVEDWMFDTRTDARWKCAFTDAETGTCVSAGAIQDTRDSYHDPYYDKFGLDLEKMPQGVNKGSSYFFFDTFTPSYASSYFRPGAYHVWGTDKVIDGAIIDKSVKDGGSWRITDPDTGAWSGVDYARTWGGRYRFHFFDLGAAPNTYEDITWVNYGLEMSNEYPQGDPPIWQYDADPLWKQSTDTCLNQSGTHYTGETPCRIMPRLARDVAYGLFFRSTAGYLYRPIPKGDVYWLATSNWTDFYSRPQWVDGAPVGAPYGEWWSDLSKLYQVDEHDETKPSNEYDDTLRWLSSATPYARWVGRKNEVIPLYDPETNQPNGKTLDTSPKYADLPAPEHHVHSGATGTELVPEPLYGGTHEHQTYPDGSTVDLTAVSNAIEKSKAAGLTGLTYDDSVNTDVFRDFVDAHRDGIAKQVPGVGTIPSVNIVFEKLFTWGLPAIAGGISIDDANGEAWGVLNNVNDRFKWCGANYPVYDPTQNHVGDKVSLAPCHPKQETGGGFSYTVEHEAAHSLGLSHPHDGSMGVDKCPEGDPNAGKWACYWQGLGWVMDISAAPTTYAMAYRPYEVEDQDNLQRGHVVEYLLGAQTSLRTQLLAEANTGRTTPSAEYTRRYDAYVSWKTQAANLLEAGDYLHSEYAARNAALAAKGVVQTGANTSNPKLVGAGQVFYFRVHPQSTLSLTRRANVKVTGIVATQPKPRETTLTATVTNDGETGASDVVVRFSDGAATLGSSSPVDLAAGATRTVSFIWSTKAVSGTRSITALADPANAVDEEDESDNALTRQVSVRGNLVPNWSFEKGTTKPTGWTPGSGTTYLVDDAHAQDGTDLVSVQASRLGKKAASAATWSSPRFGVSPRRSYAFSMRVQGKRLSSAPSLVVRFFNASGTRVGSAAVHGTGQTFAGRDFVGFVRTPAGATTARVVLKGFGAADKAPAGTSWFDSIWVW